MVAMRAEAATGEIGIVREPMAWLVSRDGLAVSQPELPLALLDPPCGFRLAAILALEGAGRPYRIAASSASLSGLKAAVRGGIAMTLRTARMRDDGIVAAPASMNLPPVPDAVFSIRLRREAGPAAVALADLMRDWLRAEK